MAARGHDLARVVGALALAATVGLGCGKGTPTAAVHDAPALGAPRPPDAARVAGPVEPDAAPIRKEDVLEGAAAEQALAAGAGETAPTAPVDAARAGALTIRPDGVGPYALRAPRDRVLVRFPTGTRVERVPGPAGEATREVATLRDAAGPYLAVRFLGGRVVELDVLAARPGLATEAGLQLGQTFEAAIDLYGPPRPIADARTGARLGWALEDLPGIVLRGTAPTGPIRGLAIIGPEATAPPD